MLEKTRVLFWCLSLCILNASSLCRNIEWRSSYYCYKLRINAFLVKWDRLWNRKHSCAIWKGLCIWSYLISFSSKTTGALRDLVVKNKTCYRFMRLSLLLTFFSISISRRPCIRCSVFVAWMGKIIFSKKFIFIFSKLGGKLCLIP